MSAPTYSYNHVYSVIIDVLAYNTAKRTFRTYKYHTFIEPDGSISFDDHVNESWGGDPERGLLCGVADRDEKEEELAADIADNFLGKILEMAKSRLPKNETEEAVVLTASSLRFHLAAELFGYDFEEEVIVEREGIRFQIRATLEIYIDKELEGGEEKFPN